MQADIIGSAQQLRQSQKLNSPVTDLFLAQIGIVCHHLHAKCQTQARDALTDPAQADNADCLAVQLLTDLLPPIKEPPALAQTFMHARQVAAQRQHQREGVLGSGDGAHTRCVHHQDTALGGALDI